jgi:group I intron endonuclease
MPLASKANFNSPFYNLQWPKHDPRPHERIRMPGKSQIKKLLRPSGIYQIRCNTNGKIYIGSAVNMLARWAEHRSRLRRGAHVNKHLQQAWIRYGEENFEFTVVEYVRQPFLLRAEQSWIDKTDCTNRDIGFNIATVAGSPPPGLRAQVWDGFIAPDGKDVTITNLHDFCRKNSLHIGCMQELASGNSRMRSYRGWTHKNSLHHRKHIRTFEDFIDPQGRSVGPITNLYAFCREHGLDDSSMYDVANGKSLSYRGWTYQNNRESKREKTYRGFINPEGMQVAITNLRGFCREHGLNIVHMRQLISGRQKRHKGWTWREDGD